MKVFFPLLLLVFTLSHSLKADTILRNGDVFEMSLAGAPAEFTGEFRIQYVVDGGQINVPIVGRIKAEGLSPTQLATQIEKKLIDGKVFSTPSVIINVVVNQRFVFIGGAVRGPGRQMWSSDMTLSQAIMAAGGPTEWAKDKVKVKRGEKSEVYSRKAINKDPTLDPKILPGDSVELTGDI